MLVSKSLAKTFRRIKNPHARKAHVEAEVLNGISHQIRILRQQRKWTQAELARRLNTSQTVVSRLEDPSYGRWNVRTLLELSNAFDVGLFVRFMPFAKFLTATADISRENLEAESYDEEEPKIGEYTDGTSLSTAYLSLSPIAPVSSSGAALADATSAALLHLGLNNWVPEVMIQLKSLPALDLLIPVRGPRSRT